jgi:hypothetical protein
MIFAIGFVAKNATSTTKCKKTKQDVKSHTVKLPNVKNSVIIR